MKKASRIMLLLVLIMIAIQMALDKTKEPVDVKRYVHRFPAVKKNRPVTILDSIPETKYTFDPDSLLMYQSTVTNDEYMEHILQGNTYRIFLEKEKKVRLFESAGKTSMLPDGARILEYVSLKGYPGRGIMLWIVNPRVYIGDDDLYTCPEITSGKGYYLGKVNISLLDEKEKKIINTVNFNSYQYTIGDTTTIEQCFQIPFAIGNPLYKETAISFKYAAIGGDKSKDGMANILYLDDYNGDGKKLEFALYQQDGCMLCNTILFGYSFKKDKLINYDVKIEYTGLTKGADGSMKDTSYSEVSKWMDRLFCYKMNRSGGPIEFDVDYRGRGGLYTKTKARYDEQSESFLVEIDQRAYLQNDTSKPGYFSPAVRIN